MSTEKMREEFELEFRNSSRVAGCQAYASAMLERGSDGEYRSFWISGAWWAWQASRAAIEVELPEGFTHHCASEQTEYVLEAGSVVAAIESLGLKVKP